jgi:hypothetical protein
MFDSPKARNSKERSNRVRRVRVYASKSPFRGIFRFAIGALGGAFLLACCFLNTAGMSRMGPNLGDPPASWARAVPSDLRKQASGEKIGSTRPLLSRALPQSEPVTTHGSPSDDSNPASSSPPEFSGFGDLAGAFPENSYLTFAASSSVFGVGGQSMLAGGISMAESTNAAPVPEPSAWLSGLGLLILVGARWARAKRRVSQRRVRRSPFGKLRSADLPPTAKSG